MEDVSATRSELLARRVRIRLAEQGRDLLKEKRTALVNEFARLSREAVEGMDALRRSASAATQALSTAVALDGPEAVGSAALITGRELAVAVRSRTVAGVRIDELEANGAARAADARGYALVSTSGRIDLAAHRFEVVLDQLLKFAVLELTLRRLVEEIERTTRRLNALEHVVVPRIATERDWIKQVLEDRELESRVRLLRARGTRERRAA